MGESNVRPCERLCSNQQHQKQQDTALCLGGGSEHYAERGDTSYSSRAHRLNLSLCQIAAWHAVEAACAPSACQAWQVPMAMPIKSTEAFELP